MRKFEIHIGGCEVSERRILPLQLIRGGKVMIQLSNSIFKNDQFKKGFVKLIASDVNHKVYYSLKRVADKLELQMKDVISPEEKRIRDEMLETVETVNAEGVKEETKKWKDEKAAGAAFQSLYEANFEIEVSKVPVSDLQHIQLSTLEWEALSPILEE